MKKEIIKSFDLASYKNGAKVKTRDGHEARIICTDAKDEKYPIIALVKLFDNNEVVVHYTSEGKTQGVAISDSDLVIVDGGEEPEFWSDKKYETIEGYYISPDSTISPFCTNINANNYGLFATERQAKSALAMARISQIMTNDFEHFGGIITDEEWGKDEWKFVICRSWNRIFTKAVRSDYYFLAFHTEAQRHLFLEKYRDLVKDFLMIG